MLQLATRYGVALFQATQETPQEADRVWSDLKALRVLKNHTKDFGLFVINPLIPQDQAIKAVQAIGASQGFTDLTIRFLVFLIKQRRLNRLFSIVDQALKIFEDAHHKGTAFVVTAFPLSKDQKNQLQTVLSKACQKEILIDHTTNPDLLGGIQIQVDSYLFDGTLRNQLTQLQRQLKEA
jgi:F-type H+-transporting ATPase subunit delta